MFIFYFYIYIYKYIGNILKKLDISNNLITKLPEDIIELQYLQILFVQNNKITLWSIFKIY